MKLNYFGTRQRARYLVGALATMLLSLGIGMGAAAWPGEPVAAVDNADAGAASLQSASAADYLLDVNTSRGFVIFY